MVELSQVKGSDKGRHRGSCKPRVPEAQRLNRIKQQPIRSVWDNNICQMKHFTGLAQYMPRFLLSKKSALLLQRDQDKLERICLWHCHTSEVISGLWRRQRAASNVLQRFSLDLQHGVFLGFFLIHLSKVRMT